MSDRRPVVPAEVRTDRMLLRPYREDDATQLLPILASSGDYLSAWLPKHVWEPVVPAELRARLAGYAEKFERDVEWRYAAYTLDERDLLGSVGLFPRNASGRAPFAEADRVEIGYWIRQDRSGEGLATEGTRAMIDLARTLPPVKQVEIRCSVRNSASGAVPRKLGFRLADSKNGDDLQVWMLNV